MYVSLKNYRRNWKSLKRKYHATMAVTIGLLRELCSNLFWKVNYWNWNRWRRKLIWMQTRWNTWGRRLWIFRFLYFTGKARGGSCPSNEFCWFWEYHISHL